jgi:succinate dehydrogenase/fumarate reductase flavoprotein subunit
MVPIHEVKADLLIVGGGIAGTNAAIRFKQLRKDSKVVLVEKGCVGKSGPSTFAAGVMLLRFPEDSLEEWLLEITENSEFLNHQDWSKLTLERSYDILQDWVSWGIDFVKDQQGKFIRHVGRAHRVGKLIEFPGLQLMRKIRDRCEESDVTFSEKVVVSDLLTRNGCVVGAVGLNLLDGSISIFSAPVVVLATGGWNIRAPFMGHQVLQGTAEAISYNAGAKLWRMEFGTIYHTTAEATDVCGLNMMVGAGARLVNRLGEDFMNRYDPQLGTRAMLNTLSTAIRKEYVEGRGPVSLDFSHVNQEMISRFPKVIPVAYLKLKRAGYDLLTRPKIPWVNTFNGSIAGGGGVLVDLNGCASLTGLYAVGDAAGPPYQGPQGVGAQNLNCGAVMGYVAAEDAASKKYEPLHPEKDQVSFFIDRILSPMRKKGPPPLVAIKALQRIIIDQVGMIREEKKLKEGLEAVQTLAKDLLPNLSALDSHELAKVIEVRHDLIYARLLLKAAIERKESRGFALRSDFPQRDDVHWLKWSIQEKDEAEEDRLTFIHVPLPYFRPDQGKYKPPFFI